MHAKRASLVALAVALAGAAAARSEDAKDPKVAEHKANVDHAIARGIAALGSAQVDGHFGRDYPVAVTSMAGLAVLAGEDEPLANPVLLKAYAYVRSQQKDGSFPDEGGRWVHVQGFATLFFAELYGRTLQAKSVPKEIAKDELRATVAKAVALLADAQSKSGGWWYTKSLEQDEGSTTVCAVQALRAAKNFGIPVEPKVLERGFAYLKAMQNEDGGFRYMGTQGCSMRAGTAAAVATLVLMSKLDERVLLNALKFLEKTGVEGIASGLTPQYGTFYSAMAMKVIDEEYGEHMPLAARWTQQVEETLLAAQEKGGTWADRDLGEMRPDYGTSLSVLALACPRGRLSVFHRRAPKLPG